MYIFVLLQKWMNVLHHIGAVCHILLGEKGSLSNLLISVLNLLFFIHSFMNYEGQSHLFFKCIGGILCAGVESRGGIWQRARDAGG